jgi:quinol monooxygenase YgiN
MGTKEMKETVTLIARITPRPGQADVLRGVLASLVAPTRREAGCVVYNLHEHRDDGGSRFSFYEIWRSEASLAEHMQTPHVTEFFSRLDELVQGEIGIERMRLLAD